MDTTSSGHILRTVTFVTQVLDGLDERTVELVLDRMHDARRGHPTGGEPPTRKLVGFGADGEIIDPDEEDDDTRATTYSDRTGTMALALDQAEADWKILAHAVADLHQAASRLQQLEHRYGGDHAIATCVECRKAGSTQPVAVGRYSDRCRWHGEARSANSGRNTPIAITRAMLARQPISDQLIASNTYTDGVSWKRPKRQTPAA